VNLLEKALSRRTAGVTGLTDGRMGRRPTGQRLPDQTPLPACTTAGDWKNRVGAA